MDKVTRQCPQTTNLFEEKGEPQRYRTEVLSLTNLTPHVSPTSGNSHIINAQSRAQELCESRGGRRGLRDSKTVIVRIVYVGVKQHQKKKKQQP